MLRLLTVLADRVDKYRKENPLEYENLITSFIFSKLNITILNGYLVIKTTDECTIILASRDFGKRIYFTISFSTHLDFTSYITQPASRSYEFSAVECTQDHRTISAVLPKSTGYVLYEILGLDYDIIDNRFCILNTDGL